MHQCALFSCSRYAYEGSSDADYSGMPPTKDFATMNGLSYAKGLPDS